MTRWSIFRKWNPVFRRNATTEEIQSAFQYALSST